MRNAYDQETLLKRLIKSPIRKNYSEKQLEEMIEKHKPFKYKDLVLIDSSILQLGKFLKKTDFQKFEDYSTKGLMHINEKIETYKEIFLDEKSKITQKVYYELEDLLKLINNRISRCSIPPEKRINKEWFRRRINNVEKAKTNKEIYGKIRDSIYDITKNSKTKLIKPSEQDQILFEIINTISSVRKLKESKTFQTKKEHNYNSKTDEWLITQAFNKTLFDQQSVTILSNDRDMARLLIDANYYLRSGFIKEQTKYCDNTLNKKPLILANPDLDIYTSKINPNSYYSIGYKKGKKDEWKEIYELIKPTQKKFIKLMKQQERDIIKTITSKTYPF